MAETRGKGEGSIYPQCSRKGAGHDNGDHTRCKVEWWIGQIDAGRKKDGTRNRPRVKRRTRNALIEALDELRRTHSTGVVPDNTTTLAGFLRWWLEAVKALSLKDGSLAIYRSRVENYIIPQLGHLKLAKVTSLHVQSFMATLKGYDLKPATVNGVRMVLSNALRYAAATGRIAANPVTSVDGLKTNRAGKTDDRLSAPEADTVLATAQGDRLEALAVLALKLGLREGELLALRWRDVDLDTGELHVRGTLRTKRYEHGCQDAAACASSHHGKKCKRTCRRQHADRCPKRTGGGVVIDKPKTENSERTLPLVAGTLEALRAHRARQSAERLKAGPVWVDTGHVFTREDGTPLTGQRVRRWWHKLCERAKVGRRRFHASRHTCATLLLDAGVPLEVVSAILGHGELATTADIYAKVSKDNMRKALAKLAV